MKISAKSAQIDLKSQFTAVFLRHMFIAGIAVVFGLGAFWWFLSQRIYNVLYSIIFICIYFGMMYTRCTKIASHDLKGYAETKAYPLKGAVLALPVLFATLIFDILRMLAWEYMSVEAGINTIPGFILNALFIGWTFPFNGVMMIEKSNISLIGHILVYTVPLVSAFLGYLAGYKKISIIEKLIPYMYEKDED